MARAVSERHWVEEWAVLQLRFLSFYGSKSKKPHLTISRDDIMRAQIMPKAEQPLWGYGFVEIHMLARVFVLMLASEELAQQWVRAACPPPQPPHFEFALLDPLTLSSTDPPVSPAPPPPLHCTASSLVGGKGTLAPSLVSCHQLNHLLPIPALSG